MVSKKDKKDAKAKESAKAASAASNGKSQKVDADVLIDADDDFEEFTPAEEK